MSTISTQIITFRDIIFNNYELCSDSYGIASYVLTSPRVAAGINCPFNASKDNCAFLFINVDGVVAARSQHFGTRFYADGKIVSAGTGSSLETAEPYRHLGIGAEIMLFIATNKEYPLFIASGISEMALPLYDKLHYYVLAFPRIMQLRNAHCVLESRKMHGGLLKLCSRLANIPLWAVTAWGKYSGKRLLRHYQVEKVSTVPGWVDNIVLNDGHKYMEVHDHRWLQWNLDYNFRGLPQDIQSFYTIKKDDKPIGFFMTKERFREKAGGILRNVLIGAIMEWGTVDDNLLSEVDIYRLALPTFSPGVDIVETATANHTVVREMRKYGFLRHGDAHIALKDKKKQYKDAKNIALWRIRYGYADVILT
ncbi:hypothetical protein [Mediterranea sp. An20]|uniref:hypothetical protein n=1 Tax=Mediterranea sp. An20 TaxID=1965586 RepID=UPI001121F38F|nr:hypothetical protein [Mediterranea sp. An20]